MTVGGRLTEDAGADEVPHDDYGGLTTARPAGTKLGTRAPNQGCSSGSMGTDSNDPVACPLSRAIRRRTWIGSGELLGGARNGDRLHRCRGSERPGRADSSAARPIPFRSHSTRTPIATRDLLRQRCLGSGTDWSSTTGITDVQTTAILRDQQRKLRLAKAITTFG